MRSSIRPSNAAPPIRVGDLGRLEARRRRAATMFRQGMKQADVARALGVSRQSVSRWHRTWKKGGMQSLKRADRTGRPTRLTAFQLKETERALLRGAVANGYPTERWTLRRVAEVIERVTGVNYHLGHVWRVLRGMGWSRQKPARQTVERDQENMYAWVRDESGRL